MLGPRGQKYALYAAGELLLVIVGILIALQVNNWNEKRIEQDQITRYAVGLISDLERDIVMLEPITEQMLSRLSEVNALKDYVRGRSLSQVNNLDLWLLTPALPYRPYEWNRTAMEQLKSAGALRKIDNTELVEKITAYEALTLHLDEDYNTDKSIFEAASNFRDLVVDSNYPRDAHFMSLVNESAKLPIESELEMWRQEYRGLQLTLLTKDMNDVKIMVNKYGKVRLIEARVHAEIPRLIGQAEKLIQLLRTEYSLNE